MNEDRQPLRRYPRWPVSIDCDVEGTSGHSSMRLSELSIGGCYIDTRMAFAEGASVTITALFPGGDLTFTGRVIYVHPGYGFGVGFDPLSDATREKLEEFLKHAQQAR
jgi:hypothetical protein